jgi:hypothetical protein
MADEKKNTLADGLDAFDIADENSENILYARHAEIETFADLEKQRGTPIPALFNQIYKFIQNPSSVSVETFKRMVDTDDTVGSGVDFLTTCLSARLGAYVHPSQEITKFVNDALDNLDGGRENTIKEMLSATWAGFFVGETVWANKDVGFVPQKIVPLPPSTILFETERTGELTPDGILQYQRGYVNGSAGIGGFQSTFGLGFTGGPGNRNDPYAKFGDMPFPLRTANSYNYLCIRIPRQKCIHYAFNAQGQFGNPYGRSLLRRCYKYYVMKDATLQMKMIALDRKGTALTIVYVDPNAMTEDASKDGDDTGTMRNNAKAGIRADMAARQAFKNIHNDSVIVLPGKKGEIYETDFMPQTSNVGDFIQAEEFCNKSILRALLLPSLVFGNGDGSGSYALGQEHAKTFDKVCDSVNAGFENVLLQQLIKPLIAYNFPKAMWEKEGVGSFSKRTLSQEEIDKEMATIETAVNIGAIDVNDMQDLNKIRQTINFEPKTLEQFQAMQKAKADAAAEQMDGMGGSGDEDDDKDDVPAQKKEKKELWKRLAAFFGRKAS